MLFSFLFSNGLAITAASTAAFKPPIYRLKQSILYQLRIAVLIDAAARRSALMATIISTVAVSTKPTCVFVIFTSTSSRRISKRSRAAL